MNAVVTSVAIPAFASWHPAHATALEIVNAGATLPAHAALETYSVLTRLPAPHRARPAEVLRFLRESFTGDWLTLPGSLVARLMQEMVDRGIAGGSTYDGLIGGAARSAGARLYTRDLRAKSTYDVLGVDVTYVG